MPTPPAGDQELAWVVVLGTRPRGDASPKQQESQEYAQEQQDIRAVQEKLAGHVYHLIWVECGGWSKERRVWVLVEKAMA
jgi:hypothetical protein